MILSEEECKKRWENADNVPIRLDKEGLQVMKWVERQQGFKREKPWNWKSGINK